MHAPCLKIYCHDSQIRFYIIEILYIFMKLIYNHGNNFPFPILLYSKSEFFIQIVDILYIIQYNKYSRKQFLFFSCDRLASPRLALFLGGVVRSGGRLRAEAVVSTGYLCTWGNVAVYEGLPRRDHCWLKTTIHSPLDRGSASPSEFLDEGAERFREAASLLPSPPLLPYPLQPLSLRPR